MIRAYAKAGGNRLLGSKKCQLTDLPRLASLAFALLLSLSACARPLAKKRPPPRHRVRRHRARSAGQPAVRAIPSIHKRSHYKTFRSGRIGPNYPRTKIVKADIAVPSFSAHATGADRRGSFWQRCFAGGYGFVPGRNESRWHGSVEQRVRDH